MRREALILGGGPAGSAAAITLARGGASPLVMERTREPADALCGGFLSWRTLEALERLGIAADALGPARATRLRLVTRRGMVETSLPAPGRGVSRARLDALLLQQAQRHGAGVERGVTIRSVEGGEVRTADGALLHSDALFLANGKHDIRGIARPASARGVDPTLGLRTRRSGASVTGCVGDAIELHLFDRGYAGVVMQEDGSANICLAIRRSRLTEAGTPERLLATLVAEVPAFAERLAGDASPIEAIANVPYGWRALAGSDGCYRLGDQAAVIPSLAGEGMGIALASGVSAATAWLAGEGGESWQMRFARATARPVTIARTIRTMAEHPSPFAPFLPIAARLGLIDAVAAATRIAHR